MGLEEPQNPSLRHINGKLQISKSPTCILQQQCTVYKSQENLTTRFNMFEIDYESKQQQQQSPPPALLSPEPTVPSLDYSTSNLRTSFRPSNFLRSQPHLAILTQIDQDLKLNLSSRLKISPKPECSTRYYQPRLLIRPKDTNESTSYYTSTTHIIQTNNNGMDTIYKQEKQEFISHLSPPLVVTRKSSCLTLGTDLPNPKPRSQLYEEPKNIPLAKPRNYSSLTKEEEEKPKPRLKKFNPMPKPRNSLKLDSSENESDSKETNSKPKQANESSLKKEIELLTPPLHRPHLRPVLHQQTFQFPLQRKYPPLCPLVLHLYQIIKVL